MSMVSSRGWPLNDASDKAENQELQYYNVILYGWLRFSILL